MNTLLVYLPYEGADKHLPLGIAYLAAVLQNEGLPVSALDMNTAPSPWYALKDALVSLAPGIVGLSFMTPMTPAAVRAATLIRNHSKKIFITAGGPHASAIPEDVLLHSSINCVVVGEGEETFLELVKTIAAARTPKLRAVKGIVFRDRDLVFRTGARGLIRDLDSIPFPARRLFDHDRYGANPLGLVKRSALPSRAKLTVFNLITSRGCTGQCAFCDSHSVFLRKFRPRTAENIMAEITCLVDEYDMKFMDFVDDTVTIQKPRIMKLCDMIIAAGLDSLRWSCNVRANTVDPELFKKMFAAGCRRVEIGVESGDPQLLDAIHKNITIDQFRQAFLWAKQANLLTMGFFMTGLPGQDARSVEKTLRLIESLGCDMPCFSLATPYPGTELFEVAREKNLIATTDWSAYVTTGDVRARTLPMKSDVLSDAELRKVHRDAVAFAARFTLRSLYGRLFFLNPALYADVLRRKNILKDWRELLSRAAALLRSAARPAHSHK
ncbi:MAG: radical SAM protein [bacterium]